MAYLFLFWQATATRLALAATLRCPMYSTKYQRIRDFLCQQKAPSYRFGQVMASIFDQRIGDFQAMTTLPQSLRTALSDEFGPSILNITLVTDSLSGQAHKCLFAVGRGQRVESVRMTYRAGWQSLCISSQAGCGLACRFCATGAIGLHRNLSADEITDQLLYFHLAGHHLDSISLMGMGEPLANPATFAALSTLTDRTLFKLSPRRITVSTVGVIPGIEQLGVEFPQVNLVFSLHSPFDEQRSELIPLNRRYPLTDILPVLDMHIRKTKRQVSIAYLLLNRVNDTTEHASAMIALLKARKEYAHLYHVNVIRYHPAYGAPVEYSPPDAQKAQTFVHWLRRAGLKVTQRPSFGIDIDAACGQLHGRTQIQKQ
jgi:23S rRNA (adenine-C8)-methyltransferase